MSRDFRKHVQSNHETSHRTMLPVINVTTTFDDGVRVHENRTVVQDVNTQGNERSGITETVI